MRAVVQRVFSASVSVEGCTSGTIGAGLVVLVGVAKDDQAEDSDFLANKVAGLRVFGDDEGRMNRAASDLGHGILCISQFTLHGDARKGRRPSYNAAAAPDKARPLFDRFVEKLKAQGLNVETGVFGAEMTIDMCAHGPVTILLDSKKQF